MKQQLTSAYFQKYSKIGKANHYVVMIAVFLLFNFFITRLELNIAFYFFPIGICSLLSIIYSIYNTYDIEVINNGEVKLYNDVKYKIDSKKNQLTVYERNGNKTTISQGNYTIKPSVKN